MFGAARAAFGFTQAASTTITTFTSSGSWVAPAGVTSARILAVGGGGAGGAGWEGGGGGGGGVVDQTFSVTAGTTYTVVVGAGGSGVSTSWPTNANGAATYMHAGGSNLVVALGGGAGSAEVGAPSSNVSRARTGGSGGGGGAVWHANGVQAFNTGFPTIAADSIQNSSTGMGQGYIGGNGFGVLSGNITASRITIVSTPAWTASQIRTRDYTMVGGGGGGGGGAGEAWYFTGNTTTGNATGLYGGNGGPGFSSNISGNATFYAGGGGCGFRPGGTSNVYAAYEPGIGGSGGGNTSVRSDSNQTGGGGVNTGGGGGGTAKNTNTGSATNANNGGSGILIIAYEV